MNYNLFIKYLIVILSYKNWDLTLLINLENDKGESNNLIEEYPEKAEKNGGFAQGMDWSARDRKKRKLNHPLR